MNRIFDFVATLIVIVIFVLIVTLTLYLNSVENANKDMDTLKEEIIKIHDDNYRLLSNNIELKRKANEYERVMMIIAKEKEEVEEELEKYKDMYNKLKDDRVKDKTFIEKMEVTAYTSGYESTRKTPSHPEYGITASGNEVKENYTVACPPSMEFGTEIYIPYFDNVFVCEDRGSAIQGRRLDVYMNNLSEALRFGRRELSVIILND